MVSDTALVSANPYSGNYAPETTLSEQNNGQILLDLNFKSGTLWDPDDDGIEFLPHGVIDFTVEDTLFEIALDQNKLCTRWEVESLDSGRTRYECYGEEICCNFIDLDPILDAWDSPLQIYPGRLGATENNIVSAQVIYVDLSSLENISVDYSEKSSLSAFFVDPETIEFFISTDKTLYTLGEQVLFDVTSPDYLGYEITITKAGQDYQLLGGSDTFSPQETGTYTVYAEARLGSIVKNATATFEVHPVSGDLVHIDKAVYSFGEPVSITVDIANFDRMEVSQVIDKELFKIFETDRREYTFIPSGPGRYAITVYGTIGGEPVSQTIYFDVIIAAEVRAQLSMKNALGLDVPATITCYEAVENGKEIHNNNNKFTLYAGEKYDLIVEPHTGPIFNIEIHDFMIEEDKDLTLRLDPVIPLYGNMSGEWKQMYAIDLSDFNLNFATVGVTASGSNVVYKCKDWNFDFRICRGEWEELQTFSGSGYTLTLTADDPGFAEKFVEPENVTLVTQEIAEDLRIYVEAPDGIGQGKEADIEIVLVNDRQENITNLTFFGGIPDGFSIVGMPSNSSLGNNSIVISVGDLEVKELRVLKLKVRGPISQTGQFNFSASANYTINNASFISNTTFFSFLVNDSRAFFDMSYEFAGNQTTVIDKRTFVDTAMLKINVSNIGNTESMVGYPVMFHWRFDPTKFLITANDVSDACENKSIISFEGKSAVYCEWPPFAVNETKVFNVSVTALQNISELTKINVTYDPPGGSNTSLEIATALAIVGEYKETDKIIKPFMKSGYYIVQYLFLKIFGLFGFDSDIDSISGGAVIAPEEEITAPVIPEALEPIPGPQVNETSQGAEEEQLPEEPVQEEIVIPDAPPPRGPGTSKGKGKGQDKKQQGKQAVYLTTINNFYLRGEISGINYSISSLYLAPEDAETAEYLAEGDVTPVITGGWVSKEDQEVLFRHPAKGRALGLRAKFGEGNVDLRKLKIRKDSTRIAVNFSGVTGVEEAHTLYFENTQNIGLYICPQAEELSGVYQGCANMTTFFYAEILANVTKDGYTVYIDAGKYVIENVTGSGAGEILITKALHLDLNKSTIEDIYNHVRALDNIWSPAIYHNEYIRVTFEQELDQSRDITLYARNNQSANTTVEVYYFNSSNKITEFPVITETKYYKVYLTGMNGSHDTFDLKIKNNDANASAYLEFDHIIDPSVLILRPDGDGHELDWTPLGGNTHFEEVNETIADDDSSYVSAGTQNYEDYWTVENHTTEIGTIHNITVWLRTKSSTGTEEFAVCIQSDGTESCSADKLDYATWTNDSETWLLNPADDQAWEWADIDVLEIGVKSRAIGSWGGTTAYVTQAWVEVHYTLQATAPYGMIIHDIDGKANNSATNDNQPEVNFTVQDSEQATLSCELYVNGSVGYGANSSIPVATPSIIEINQSLGDGNYTVFVNCSDNGLTNVSDTWAFTIDTASPNVTLNLPAADYYNDTSSPVNVPFNCSVTDNHNLTNLSLYITDSTNSSFTLNQTMNTSGTYNSSNWALSLQNGNYTWNCIAYDAAGNSDWGDANRSIEINSTATASVEWNQSTLSLSADQGLTGSKNATVNATNSNENVVVTEVFTNATDFNATPVHFITATPMSLGDMNNNLSEVRFECSPSKVQAPGNYTSIFNVKSDQNSTGDNITVACTVNEATPLIEIITPADNSENYSSTVTVEVIVDRVVPDGVTYSLNGAANVSMTKYIINYTQRGADQYRTSAVKGRMPKQANVLWMINVTGEFDIFQQPTIKNDILYIAGKDYDDDETTYAGHRRTFFINATTGEQICNITTGGTDSPLSIGDNGMAYMASIDGSYNTTYALNATNCQHIWNFTYPGKFIGAPALDQEKDMVFVNTKDYSRVFALNSTTGAHIWNVSLGFYYYYMISSITIYNDKLYVPGFTYGESGGNLFIINESNGAALYATQNELRGYWDSSPTIDKDTGIFYIGGGDGNIYAYNATNLEVEWKYDTGSRNTYMLATPALHDGTIFAGGATNKIYALDAKTGELKWDYSTGNDVYSSPVVADGKIVFGSLDNKTYVLNETDGSLIWSYDHGGQVFGSPALVDGILYMPTDTWMLYAFGNISVIYTAEITPTSGSNTIIVYANNSDNDLATDTITFTSNTTLPTLSNAVVNDTSVAQNASVRINMTATHPGGNNKVTIVNATIRYPNSSKTNVTLTSYMDSFNDTSSDRENGTVSKKGYTGGKFGCMNNRPEHFGYSGGLDTPETYALESEERTLGPLEEMVGTGVYTGSGNVTELCVYTTNAGAGTNNMIIGIYTQNGTTDRPNDLLCYSVPISIPDANGWQCGAVNASSDDCMLNASTTYYFVPTVQNTDCAYRVAAGRGDARSRVYDWTNPYPSLPDPIPYLNLLDNSYKWGCFLAKFNDSNTTDMYTNYTDYTYVTTNEYGNITQISVIVEVDSYDPNASAEQGNAYPDLELYIYTGGGYESGFMPVANFSLNNTYTGGSLNTTNVNFTVNITTAAYLNAWQQSYKNRNIKVRGVGLDWHTASIIDEINYVNVWVKIYYQNVTGVYYTDFNNTDQFGTYNITNGYGTDSYGNSNSQTFTATYFKVTELNPPNVTLNLPAPDYHNDTSDPVDVLFNCSVTDDTGLTNISLYITDSTNSSFTLNQTTNIGGTSNSSNWTLSLQNGNYTWNCLAYDTSDNSDWGDANRSIEINATPAVQPTIGIYLVSPTTDINATQYGWFNVTVNVSCYNADCGNINVSLDPESSAASVPEEILAETEYIYPEIIKAEQPVPKLVPAQTPEPIPDPEPLVKEPVIESEIEETIETTAFTESVIVAESDMMKITFKSNKPEFFDYTVNQRGALYDLEIVEQKAKGVKVNIRGMTELKNITVYSEAAPEKQVKTVVRGMRQLTQIAVKSEVFAVNESFEFTNATITLPVEGKVSTILHCPDFNTDTGECMQWLATGIPFTEADGEVTFTVNEFSAYIAGQIQIINTQSYPTLNGNWTVLFSTNGSANLTITPVLGTAFMTDLDFLELKCGNTVLNATYNGSSVFYQNYSCNETGTEISMVKTPGKHVLKFEFGISVDYAYNLVNIDAPSVLIDLNLTGDAIGHELLWKTNATGTYDEFGGTSVLNDRLAITSKQGWPEPGPDEDGFTWIACLNHTTGEFLWNETYGNSDATPYSRDDKVYHLTYNGFSTAFIYNTTTGLQICNYTFEGNDTYDGSANSPLVEGDYFYFAELYDASVPSLVWALNATDCTPIWNQSFGVAGWGSPGSSPSYYEDIVYISGGASTDFYAQNATTGDHIWNTSLNAMIWDSSPTIATDLGRVYVGTTGSRLYSLNNDGVGGVNWSYDPNGDIYRTPSYHDDKLFFSTADATEHMVYGLNASTGAELWTTSVTPGDSGSNYGSYASVYNDFVFMLLIATDKVHLFNETNGDEIWSYQMGAGSFSAPAVADGILSFTTDDWYVYAFDIGVGTGKNWSTLKYDNQRTGYCSDCLTEWQYVKANCTTASGETVCTITNNYDHNVSNVTMNNNDYNVNWYNSSWDLLKANSSFYAMNTTDLENDSSITIFLLEAGLPTPFDLLLPANGTRSANLTPFLDWEDTSDADFQNYTVEVDDDADFTSVNYTYVLGNTVTNSSYQVTSDWTTDTIWYWKVTAYDSEGNSTSSISTFTYFTDTTPPHIYLEAPANNTKNTTSRQPDFIFNATDNMATNMSCVLWMNNTNSSVESYGINDSVLNATTTTISANDTLADDNYTWWINCSDRASQNMSEVRNLTIDFLEKGLISTAPGTEPFWTNDSNPRIINLNNSQSQLVTFWVNATGSINSVWEFFAYANLTSDESISNTTSKFNVTIIEGVNTAPYGITIHDIDGKANNSVTNDNQPEINFTVQDSEESTLSCELYVNSSVGYGANSSIPAATPSLIEINQTLGDGNYTVFVNCSDGSLTNVSDTWTFFIDTSPPNVTLNLPAHPYYNDTSDPVNVPFNCSVTDNYNLTNLSLYITNSLNQSFTLNQTMNTSGTYNSSNWILSLQNGNYTWNCLAYDSVGYTDWGDANRSIEINYTAAGTYCNGAYSSGDWDISTAVVCENETVPITGNVTIQQGGNLTLRNATFTFNLDGNGTLFLNKTEGGALFITDLDNDKATTNDRSVLQPNETGLYYDFFAWGVNGNDNLTVQYSRISSAGLWNGVIGTGAITMCNVSDALIKGNYINDTRGILLDISNNSIVVDNTINDSMWAISCERRCNNVTIANNTINNIDQSGIILQNNSNNNKVLNNTLINITVWDGITLQNNANYNLIQDNTVSNTTGTNYGIMLYFADYNTIDSNEVTYNAYPGILVDRSNYVNVTNNIAHNNTWYGIFTERSNNTRIINNTVNNNSVHGIYVTWESEDILIENNTANINTEVGIYIYNSSRNVTIQYNTVNSNIERGMLIWNVSEIYIYNNTAINNGNWGLIFDEVMYGEMAENNVSGSAYAQIGIDYGACHNLIKDNIVSGGTRGIGIYNVRININNTIQGNNVSDATDYGLAIEQANNFIIANYINNTVGGASSCGMLLQANGSNTTIIGNRINHSGYCGMWIYQGIDNTFIDNTHISNSSQFGILGDTALNITFANSSINGDYNNVSYYEMWLLNGAKMIATNSTFLKTEPFMSDTAVLTRRWYVQGNVTDQFKSPVSGATVKGYFNNSGTWVESFSSQTGADGLTGWREIVEYNQSSGGFTYFTWSNFTANKSSVANETIELIEYSKIFNLTISEADVTPPNCTIVSVTPSNLTIFSGGAFEAIINCTDPSGLNVTLTGNHYNTFVTRTIHNLSLPYSPFLGRFWSLYPPANNLTVSGGPVTEPILRAMGRNESFWYETLGIFNDTYSYAVNDGENDKLNVTTGSDWALLNYTWLVESTGYSQMHYLTIKDMEAEIKKDYEVFEQNALLVKFWNIESMRDIDNYTMSIFVNVNFSGAPVEDLTIYYCNSSYNISGTVTPLDDITNCVFIQSLSTADLNGSCDFTSRNSSYISDKFSIINGEIGGIEATGANYLYYQSDSLAATGKFLIRYANGSTITNVSFSETQTAWTTNDGGNNFIQANFTPDIWDAQAKVGDQFQMGVYITDLAGNNYTNLVLYNDSLDPLNLPISSPNIETYTSDAGGFDITLDGAHSRNMTIHVNIGIDPNVPGTVNHSLYLCNLDGTINYTINASFYSPNDSDLNISFNTSLVDDGEYRMNVTAVADDNSSNIESVLTVNNFTIDNTPPFISDENATNIYADRANIVWTTDEDSNSSVNYGDTTALGTIKVGTARVTSHNVLITGLMNNTLYYYNVTSCDIAGNCNTTGPYNFTTTSVTLPVINAINDTPDPIDQNQNITITANVTAGSYSVNSVWVTINGTNYSLVSATSAEEVGIHFAGFEAGDQGWNFTYLPAGAADSERIAEGALRPPPSQCDDSGDCSAAGGFIAHLQDDTLDSRFNQSFSFTGYDSVNISFWSWEYSFEPNEYVQVLCDGNEIWRLTDGDYAEEQWIYSEIELSTENCTFDDTVEIKFLSDGMNGDADDWYVDGINLTGIQTSGNIWNVTVNITTLVGIQNYTVYANDTQNNRADPVTDNFTVTDANNPTVTLNLPGPEYYDDTEPTIVTFNCSVTDDYLLQNLSLYITDQTNSSFTLNQTMNTTGTYNSSNWQLDLNNGNYTWNCLAYDSSGNSDWGDANRSIEINASYCQGQYFSGDWDILTNVVCENETVPITGNVTILQGGNLTLRNATFNFNLDYNGSLFINKSSGGGLWIYDLDSNQATTNDKSILQSNETGLFFDFYVFGSNDNDNFTMQYSEVSQAGVNNGSFGILLKDLDNVVLRGNRINHSRYLYLNSTNNSLITDNIFVNNLYGIVVQNSNYINITNNTIIDSTDDNIYIYGNSTGNRIINNTLNESGDNGLNLEYISNHVIQDNTIWNNTNYGIYTPGPTTDNLFDGNDIRFNGFYGIYSTAGLRNNFTNNQINYNGIYGLTVAFDSNDSRIINNTLINNTYSGIYLYGNNSNHLIENNTAKFHPLYGIFLDEVNTNVTIKNNTVLNNSDRGIQISNGTDIKIYSNFIVNNSNWGIVLDSANNSIVENNTVEHIGGGTAMIALDLDANNNIIRNNTVVGGLRGISIYNVGGGSINNTIIDNSVSDAQLYGITLETPFNYIINNNINNTWGVNSAGILLWLQGYNSTVEDTIINYTNTNGIWIDQVDNTVIDNTKIDNTNYYAIYAPNSQNITLSNSTLTANYSIPTYYEIWLLNGALMTSINSTFNKSEPFMSDTAILTTKWYVRGNVTTNVGNPIDDATVKGYFNNSGTWVESFSTQTEASGLTGWREIVEYNQSSTGFTYFTQSNFTANKSTSSNETIELIEYSQTININITLDDVENPNITLNLPAHPYYNDTSDPVDIPFNCSATDNINLFNISLYITDSTNSSFTLNQTTNIGGTSNSSNWTLSLQNGNYTWNCLAYDTSDNSDWGDENRSIEINFTGAAANIDLTLNATDIQFNDSNPNEKDNITINATIYNLGTTNATDVIVQFFEGNETHGTQINGNLTVNISATSNVTMNITYNATIGNKTITVVVDPPTATNGSITEYNESNNYAATQLHTRAHHIFWGQISGNISLADASGDTMYSWTVASPKGVVYLTDIDSGINFLTLQALGKNSSGANATTDFSDVDSNLNMTDFNDSVSILWTGNNGSVANFTKSFTLTGLQIDDVPIINSTNNSQFVTGIVWDYSDDIGADGEYDTSDQEDLLFITNISNNAASQYGAIDYEVRVPAIMRTYDSGTEGVVFYVELE
ncbi:MAG: right-handed parallel beta-helix repeat-containing protein [Nanoarchaeota archaeon]|nr:right-handed parallel beta-helix repeat-containing protein [Nanoarchaeota archaeon]